MTTYQKAREALGLRLRELRLDVRPRLTGARLAADCGWDRTKISKIENGRTTPTVEDIEAWTQACGQPQLAGELAARLRTLESYYVEHRRLFRAGLAPRQREWLQFEDETATVRNFETTFIPGLLQTEPYARHRLAAGRKAASPADLDDAVAARMQRQQVLYRPGKAFVFLLTEAVLRYGMAAPDVMAGQLDRLSSALSLPTVRIGVIPFGRELPVAPKHGFHLLDRAVLVELFTSTVTLTERGEIEEYAAIFAKLSDVAEYGRDARAIIDRVMRDLDG